MTLDNLTDNLRAANDQTEVWQVMKSFIAARAAQPKPTPGYAQINVEFYEELDASKKAKRTSLTQLRHRHLDQIDRVARRPHYDRESYQEYWLENYDRLFGPLRRPRSKETPFDISWRKPLMIGLLLDKVEERRAYFIRRNLI
jgi:hypothetical protein